MTGFKFILPASANLRFHTFSEGARMFIDFFLHFKKYFSIFKIDF